MIQVRTDLIYFPEYEEILNFHEKFNWFVLYLNLHSFLLNF